MVNSGGAVFASSTFSVPFSDLGVTSTEAVFLKSSRDDEEDQKHAQDVDQRNDVDFGTTTVAGFELHRGRARQGARRGLLRYKAS